MENGTRLGTRVPDPDRAMLRWRSLRAALSVLVLPLDPNLGQGGAGVPIVAMLVSDPEQRVETPEKTLCRLYALATAEARLTGLLMQGKSFEEARRELDISANTARTHLKHIFEKTDTSRQGELISLLLSGPALLRLDRA